MNILVIVLITLLSSFVTVGVDSAQVINVPGDAPTIQAAIDLASDGDMVLVAPGTYHENIQISRKTITLASQFYTFQDASFIDQTIIDGGGNTVIHVDRSVGPETKIIGFTIQNGNDGISAFAKLHILNNRFTGNKDAIDYQGGGGICRNNVFERNQDDGVDLDGPSEAIIEDNLIRNNHDDGIEVRLHPYSGPTLNIIIRRNIIEGNDEDGIQLIDYPDVSDRVFLIERNVIKDSIWAGLGLMDNGESGEDFRGASIPERIQLFNNTFINNNHGLTGGDNLIAVNNIFVDSTAIAMKNVDGNSIAAYNLFWGSGTVHQNSNLDTATTILADPRLDGNDQLMPGSPAIDAGTVLFEWNSEVVLDIQPGVYAGLTADLGAYETETHQIFFPVIMTTGPIVWVEDGMTRVFKNDPARVNPDITLYTAKNEYEPFQIIVKAPATNVLTNVNVTISDLTGPNGALISSNNITLYREHYLYVTQGSKSSNSTTNQPLGPGWYPDALIPFSDPLTHEDLTGQLDAVPFNLAAGENQPIWVDIYTPADTPPGLYNGTATVTSQQGVGTMQVSLNVWNFSLPTQRSLRSHTKAVHSDMSRASAIELLKHRFNPKLVRRSDERFLIDNYGLDMVHVYNSSGASLNHCSIDPLPAVSDILTATVDHEPELYLYTSYANEIWPCTDIYPELLGWAANLRLGGSHPILVMYPIDELMGPDLDNTAADIWVVLPKHYDQAKSNIDQLINHPTTEVWSYNPLVQDGYSPKFTIDFLPINSRIMQGFINQSLGLTGTKFWQVDFWTDDPWNNAEAYRVDAPGEGAMVYPGEEVGLPNQIVSGVRMKWFREGSEDYEYIQILKNLGEEQFALNIAGTVGADFHTWTQDKDVLYAARKVLGDKIHDLTPGLKLRQFPQTRNRQKQQEAWNLSAPQRLQPSSHHATCVCMVR